jgi:hypothetical protein
MTNTAIRRTAGAAVLPHRLGLIGGFRSPASALGLYYCSDIVGTDGSRDGEQTNTPAVFEMGPGLTLPPGLYTFHFSAGRDHGADVAEAECHFLVTGPEGPSPTAEV